MESSETAATEVQVHLFLYPVGGRRMGMRMQYTAHDPFAVRALFDPGDGHTAPVEWVLSRDLLSEGLQRHAGHGDVRVWPAQGPKQDMLYIALGRPGESALIEVSHQEVELFLRRTESLVPMGTEHEHVQWDAELACLLSTN
jgi:hypothetical protein